MDNIIDQLAGSLSLRLVAEKDSAIQVAVGDLDLASLEGRLVINVAPNGVETVTLDNRPIIQFHPVQFSTHSYAQATTITAKRSYRTFD